MTLGTCPLKDVRKSKVGRVGAEGVPGRAYPREGALREDKYEGSTEHEARDA